MPSGIVVAPPSATDFGACLRVVLTWPIVPERLGHSTVNLTLNTYSHVLPTLQKDAAETMDRQLEAGRG